MTFVRVNPAGWIDNITPHTAAQLNQSDINTSRAVDGTAGGPYSPASAVEIDGSGIKTDTLVLDGTCTMETGGAFQVDTGATFDVDPDATFNGELSVDQVIRLGDGDTGPGVQALIRHENWSTPGAAPIDPLLGLVGQNGRTQTAGADNNDGGRVVVSPGFPGTGGSGAAGGDGSFHVNGTGVFANEEGLHVFAKTFAIIASGSATLHIPTFMFPDDSLSFVEVEVTSKAAGAITSFERKGTMVMSNSVGSLSFPGAAIGDIATDVGFTLPPTYVIEQSSEDNQLRIVITENDAIAIRCLLVVRISCVGSI